jgi:hypothetical protein
MIRFGTIGADDLKHVFMTDSVDEAFDFIVRELTALALDAPGGRM